MAGVIDQAIDDLLDPDLSEAAVEWFSSISEEPCSFRWVCEHLNLSFSAVWSALARRNAKLLAHAGESKRPKLGPFVAIQLGERFRIGPGLLIILNHAVDCVVERD